VGKMALKVGELTAYINGDNTGLDKTLKESKGNMKSAGAAIGGAAVKAAKVVAAAGIGIGIASLKLSADWNDSSRKVSTIADAMVLDFEQIKSGSMELSNEIGIDVNEINEALYQMISATGDSENAFDMVRVAAKASIGGFTDTTTAVDGLTSVMNAYGKKGTENMISVSDQMLMAQNIGKTTFGEMASAIGKVAPTANALNVSTEELFTSIAILTKNGIKTTEAVTGLKAAYSNVLKPTTDAAKAAEELGVEFTAARLSQIGWASFLDEISVATGGNAEAMAQLFGSVEALNTMLVLTSKQGAEDFDSALEDITNSAGSTEEAFETMDQGLGDSLDDAVIKIKNTGAVIGDELAPYLIDAADKAAEMAQDFHNLTEKEQQAKIDTAILTTEIGIGVIVADKALSIYNKLPDSIKKMGKKAVGAAWGVGKFAIANAAAAGTAAVLLTTLLAIKEVYDTTTPETWTIMDRIFDNPTDFRERWEREDKARSDGSKLAWEVEAFEKANPGQTYDPGKDAKAPGFDYAQEAIDAYNANEFDKYFTEKFKIDTEIQDGIKGMLDTTNRFKDEAAEKALIELLNPELEYNEIKLNDAIRPPEKAPEINYEIIITGNTISDNFDLYLLGEKLVNRLNHAGVTSND